MNTDRLYYKVKSTEEAIQLASLHGDDIRYLAGGTDAIVNKFQGNADNSCLIDLTGINELKEVSVRENTLRIGSLVRLDDLKKYDTISENFPALLKAAQSVASPVLRKTATIGGNILCENRCIFYNQSEWWREAVGYCLKCDGDICIATGGRKNCFSKFVSDTAPVLICYDASIEIENKKGVSVLKLEDIYSGDGINHLKLEKNAIIRSILLPLGNGYQCIFNKLRNRESVDFTSLTTAVSMNNKGRIKIALGGVDPAPVVVEGEAGADISELVRIASKKSRIVDNDNYSRLYRKTMIGIFLNRSFLELNLKN